MYRHALSSWRLSYTLNAPRNIARFRDFLIRDFVIAPTIVLQRRGVGHALIVGA